MRIRLKDAFDLQMGKTPARNTSSYWDGNHKWISIADIGSAGKYIATTKERITDKAITESGIRAVPAHTVIMSFKLSIGKTAITSEEMYTNEAIMAFISNGTYAIDTDYLYHMCCGTAWTEGTNKAVMGLTLNKATLSEKRISLPEITEQRNIAAKFDALDNVIEKTQSELSSLDQLVKSRFVEMFGEPIANTHSLPLISLSEVGSWNSGGTPSRSNPAYYEGDIDWYSAGELNTLYLEGSVEKITQDALENSTAKLFPAGSMLVGMYDTAAFKMGILKWSSASNQACACIAPNNSIDIVWLYHVLQIMKPHFLEQRRGIRQKNLNLGMIKSFQIPYASKPEQNRFAAFVAEVDKSKLAVKQSLEKLETLKKSLMQQYFG